jgi:hypothetical protein
MEWNNYCIFVVGSLICVSENKKEVNIALLHSWTKFMQYGPTLCSRLGKISANAKAEFFDKMVKTMFA